MYSHVQTWSPHACAFVGTRKKECLLKRECCSSHIDCQVATPLKVSLSVFYALWSFYTSSFCKTQICLSFCTVWHCSRLIITYVSLVLLLHTVTVRSTDISAVRSSKFRQAWVYMWLLCVYNFYPRPLYKVSNGNDNCLECNIAATRLLKAYVISSPHKAIRDYRLGLLYYRWGMLSCSPKDYSVPQLTNNYQENVFVKTNSPAWSFVLCSWA